MKDSIVKILSECSPKHRTRLIQKTQNLKDWFTSNYPAVPLDIAVYSLLQSVSPYCGVCGKPVKTRGKKTCSTQCRTQSLAGRLGEITEKRKRTNLDRYGSSSPSGSPEVAQRRLDTMVEKYGAKVSPKTAAAARSRAPQLNQKGRKTLKERHGVCNPGQMPDHREKCAATLVKNYGVDNYYQSQEFKTLASQRNLEKWSALLTSSIALIDIADNIEKQSIFENPNKEIKFKCTRCETADIAPSETVKWRLINTGTPCRSCGGISSGSVKQQKLHDFINSLGVSTIPNYRLSNNKQIDIVCPEHHLGFEFDGLYWHNDLRLEKTYHSDKTIAAAAHGIRLVHIFEDEWDYKRPIVESRVKHLLGISSKSVFARKCEVKLVDKTTENQFMECNHIQGTARSAVSYGLYHNHELVSVMSFSKPSVAKGQKNIPGHWELLRFCSVLNTTVVGGAGRLLSHFIKIHSPEQILSFADSRWSVGTLYQTLGFRECAHTALNYWYIKGDRRYHRYALRKNASDNQELTEYQNRINQGYLRIWDCGSSKWVWTP